MDVVLATRNSSKIEQIRALFAGSAITLLSLDEAGVMGSAPEMGNTLKDNAAEKAHFAHERMTEKKWAMSDDSGLFIDALGGIPGVHAANWGGAGITADERRAFCLRQMEQAEDRSATFRTCVVLVSPEGKEHVFFGEVPGRLLKEPRVPSQPMMPYSSLFVPVVPEGNTRSWAEMSTEEENEISHRGIAFRQARAFLEMQ